ncbi:MAG: hypothetical protein JO317_09255 [Verrucomicrobiae bacterium]|nr:hypothetical protein [Verrucomicrobiae bacterium]
MGTPLANKIENGLNEARILILGSQILFGFQLRSMFEPGFDRLAPWQQGLKLTGALLIVVTLVCLMAPAAYHRLVEEGNVSSRLHRFIGAMIFAALLPFALTLGVDFYLGFARTGLEVAGRCAGVIATGIAFYFWYGLEFQKRQSTRTRLGAGDPSKPDEVEEVPLSERITQALTECRVILPGAQALLGFQLAITFMSSYETLARALQILHLVSLGLTGICVVLLMTPSAYHRIVEEGEDSEDFLECVSRTIITAMVPLSLAIGGDLFVVVSKVSRSETLALAVAAASVLFSLGLWFGYTSRVRSRRGGAAPRRIRTRTRT